MPSGRRFAPAVSPRPSRTWPSNRPTSARKVGSPPLQRDAARGATARARSHRAACHGASRWRELMPRSKKLLGFVEAPLRDAELREADRGIRSVRSHATSMLQETTPTSWWSFTSPITVALIASSNPARAKTPHRHLGGGAGGLPMNYRCVSCGLVGALLMLVSEGCSAAGGAPATGEDANVTSGAGGKITIDASSSPSTCARTTPEG
jgi:hypothetical protein